MIELTMYNIRKHFGDVLVLQDASFKIYEGEKVGIVGANGCGKSTILKLLAGIETMDVDYRKICEGRGRILIPKGTSLAYLEQIPDFPEGIRVGDILKLAFQELDTLEAKLRELEAEMEHLQGEPLDRVLNRYSQLQQKYDAMGGYDREEKLSRVCTGLKFGTDFLEKNYNFLSGGEKTTVALGKLLLESADILLLDEPTNHLDMESMEWLEGYLKNYRGIVIIVSHDRYFLDHVVSKIVEVENHACETYDGNYSDYVRQKEEAMLLQFEHYKEQKKKISSMEKSIKDLREWALRADNNKFFRRAVSMQRKLDRMERIGKPVFEKQSIRINFVKSDRLSFEILKVSGLRKGYGDRILLEQADLHVTLGERVALIGPNGSGKSTFIRMLLGELPADSGTAAFGASVKIAYLPQHITFSQPEELVIDCFRENRMILEGKAREYLAKYMFFGKDPYKRVKHLSGGEKVRLKLAMLLYDEVNLLILDEPTNHLDIESIEALEEALEDFEGTILFISHDRFFINKVGSRVVAIEDRRLVDYQGNYEQYKCRKNEKDRQEVSQQAVRQQPSNKDKAVSAVKNDEKGPSRLESEIQAMEEQLKEIDASMKAENDPQELHRLYCKREELDRELEKRLVLWIKD